MKVKLTWTCDGLYESFNVYRSDSPIDRNNLPFPIAIQIKEKEYTDNSVTNEISYYAVGNEGHLSDTLRAEKMNYDKYILSLKPVSYWKLDEEAGTSLKDYSDNSLNANLSNTHNILYQAKVIRKDSKGAMGFAVNSTSISQCISPADPKLYNLASGSFTIAYWCYKVADTTFGMTINQCADPFSGRNTNFRVIAGVELQIEENSRRLHIGSLPIGSAHFICYVYDTVNKKYFAYKNDSKIVGTYYEPKAGNQFAVSTHFPAYYNWDYYGFRGYMSDMSLFNRALTEQEVLELYEYGKI